MNRIYIIMILVAISAIPMFYFIPYLNEKYADPYLFGGLIVVEVFLFLIGNMIEGKRHLQDRRESHTKDLNHVYLRLSDVSFREENKRLVLTFPKDHEQFRDPDRSLEEIFDTDYDPRLNRISKEYLYMYKDYYYFDYAIEHLKNRRHRNIYEHWEKTNTIIEEYNNAPKFVDRLTETIKTKIHLTFPEFTTRNNIEDEEGNFYDLRLIFDFISNVIQNEKGDDYIDFLKIDKSDDDVYSICTRNFKFYGQLSSIDENKIDLDKYKLTIKSIIQDNDVRKSLELDTKKRLELISEQKKFSDELEILIKKLKAGSIIDGKCEGCSTF